MLTAPSDRHPRRRKGSFAASRAVGLMNTDTFALVALTALSLLLLVG